VLDLLLPQRCLVCSLPGDHVCGGCRSALRLIEAPLCERCGAPTAWPVRRCAECAARRISFAKARAAVAYDEPVRRLVAAWKERGLRRLAGWAAELVGEFLAPPDVAVLTFVPADRDRRLWRGDHAAERLTRELGLRWGLPVAALLERTVGSTRQRGLSRAERRRNVGGVFAPRGPVPRRVGLVDDVYTTGATVNSAASALRKGGARGVEVVTFARTIRIR
jgi:predicted amidophosphoribosyltransferase